jgi:transcriptional regulator with XRE-family HTH domain
VTGSRHDVPAVFGRRLRSERESRGLTLRQFGTKAGVNATTVLRAEHGSDVALSIAVALAEALGLPLAALLAELKCARCGEMPPAGFICSACGREGKSSSDEKGPTP